MDLPVIQPTRVKPLQSVLIKPTGADCNLDCVYCFYLEKAELYPNAKVHRMSVEVLEEMVRQIMNDGGQQVSFGWQGGEPTMMGVDFFRKAVEFQQKYGRRGQVVGNGLQTNGLLINEEWCEFLREYQFLVGLSLDGPEHIHDKYRFTKGGRPSWERVRESGRLMLDRGVAVNALVVVNDYSCNYADEIYDFHKDMGFEFMQFIPCVELDHADSSRAASWSVSAEQYGRFLCDIFDRWKADFRDGKPTTSVRWIDSVFHTYVGMQPPECTLLQECGCYVVVEHNGDIYSCDFFVEPEWKLGNLTEGRIIEMLNSERQQEFGVWKSKLPPECPECQWLTHCWGGCTKDRLRDPHDRGSNHFCQSYIMFFEHADAELRRLADEWLENQQREHDAAERRLRELRQSVSASTPPAPEVGRNEPCPCGSGKKYKKCCGK
ncbi:MAG: anaerobic sulfatase maturase [bacterium]|nr:anaerobic sulfatase maturase [bacterium]